MIRRVENVHGWTRGGWITGRYADGTLLEKYHPTYRAAVTWLRRFRG